MNNSTEKDFFCKHGARVALGIPLKDRVRVLLLKLGRSQNWLAEQCSVSSGTMSQIVNEIWTPSSKLMIKMSSLLGCDSVVLFGDTRYWKNWRENNIYEGEKK